MTGLTHFIRALICFVGLSVLLCGQTVAAQSEEEPALKIDENIEVQRSNPFADINFDQKFPVKLPPDFQTSLPQAEARELPKRSSFSLGFLSPLFSIFFWVVLALAVALVIYAVVKEIIRARRNYAPKEQIEEMPDIPVYQPDEETARVLLEDADKLAAEGKYEEAVHMLLFRSIQDISVQRPNYVKRSLTSREISNLPILTQKAREGFSVIGKLVERSFFGGRALDSDDYAASKSAYENFAFEKVSA